MQELERKLEEKEVKIANLAICLIETEREKTNKASCNKIVITLQDISKLIAKMIKEHQEAMSPSILGYRNPNVSYYDSVPFPKGYQKLNFEKFDGGNG